MHHASFKPCTSFTRVLPGLAAALALAAVLPACDVPDTLEPPAADDESLPELPELTAEELAALQARATVASFTVADSGRITIVGTPDRSVLAYQVSGGRVADDVLLQLIDAQQASPAEVFLALAEPGAAVPEPLLAEHRARAARDPQVGAVPRQLAYVLPRLIEPENLGCHAGGGEPIEFDDWEGDWLERFACINVSEPYSTTTRNTADGIAGYLVAGDLQGRALSACNAAWNDVAVAYYVNDGAPGPTSPFTFIGGTTLEEFDGVHLYSTGSAPGYLMRVNHSHPDPDTYVGYGRRGNGC